MKLVDSALFALILDDHTPSCPNEMTRTFLHGDAANRYTVKPVLSGHSNINKTKVLNKDVSLMQVESIAEFFLWSILQYF